MNIPLLTIGSFALILQFLPFFSAELFQNFFLWINRATFGILGITCTISISYCYARLKSGKTGIILGNIFSAISASLIFNGFFLEGFDIASFGTQGMCNSIFSALVVSWLYFLLVNANPFQTRIYTVGADLNYNIVLSIILPMAIVISFAYTLNSFLFSAFSVVGVEALFQKVIAWVFSRIENISARTLLYVFLTCFLWFFGIHGINVLNSVDHVIFPDGVGVVVATDAIITKPFIDVFVFMGGCGATIGLLLAIFLFGRQKTNRRLAKMAAIPMLFNINELMLFGLPIVLNPYFFIPFLLTPLASTGTAYLAVRWGLVPPPELIHWVTPILVGGYKATGSIAGVVLQLVNILLSTLIYRWFLIRYEKATDRLVSSEMGKLVVRLREMESSGAAINLMDLQGTEGIVVKMLVEDLRHILASKEELQLYYQPQFNNKGQCIGAEALLRWDHPRCGMIYPPLVVGIAKDHGMLAKLEQHVLITVCKDIETMVESDTCPPSVSVNITSTTIQCCTFPDFLERLLRFYPKARGRLSLEITEKMSIMAGETGQHQLRQIRELGIPFIVDDFSMGHASLQYLQTNLFDLVKLDGSLIRDILVNRRSKEIVASILRMSRSLNFSVLAEYVETEEQQQLLEGLGCNLYQGYLYSPAVPYPDLAKFLTRAEERELVTELAVHNA